MQFKEDPDILSPFYKRLCLSFYIFAGVVVAGAVGYKLIVGKEYSLLDGLYMTIITLSTVGYGEIIDLTAHPGGRVFTIMLILFGMGVL